MKPTSPAPRADWSRSRWPRVLAAVAVAILAIVGIAWCGYWLLLSSRLEAGVQQWIAQRRAQGYTIGYAAIARGGFPRSVDIVVTAPALAMPANAAPVAWSAARVVVAIDLFRPRRLRVNIPGAHVLSVGRGLGQVRYEVEAGQFMVVGERREAVPTNILTVRDLVLRPVGGGATAPVSGSEEALTIARLDARGRPAAPADAGKTDAIDTIDTSYHVVVSAAGIVLPGRLDPPLGHVVQRIDAEASVQGELALAPWPEALFRWRDAGGVLDIAELEAAYGPLALSGSGTVALDEAGQPVAAFAAQASGLSQLIDALRARGDMGQGEALAAKLALSVLAGRGGPLNLPLTLQDRILSVGPIPLMQISKVDWLVSWPR